MSFILNNYSLQVFGIGAFSRTVLNTLMTLDRSGPGRVESDFEICLHFLLLFPVISARSDLCDKRIRLICLRSKLLALIILHILRGTDKGEVLIHPNYYMMIECIEVNVHRTLQHSSTRVFHLLIY